MPVTSPRNPPAQDCPLRITRPPSRLERAGPSNHHLPVPGSLIVLSVPAPMLRWLTVFASACRYLPFRAARASSPNSTPRDAFRMPRIGPQGLRFAEHVRTLQFESLQSQAQLPLPAQSPKCKTALVDPPPRYGRNRIFESFSCQNIARQNFFYSVHHNFAGPANEIWSLFLYPSPDAVESDGRQSNHLHHRRHGIRRVLAALGPRTRHATSSSSRRSLSLILPQRSRRWPHKMSWIVTSLPRESPAPIPRRHTQHQCPGNSFSAKAMAAAGIVFIASHHANHRVKHLAAVLRAQSNRQSARGSPVTPASPPCPWSPAIGASRSC